MKFKIDYERVREILDQNPPLDEYSKYYRQYSAKHKRIGLFVPETKELLQRAFCSWMHVLDVGCGRGDTLLDCADFFRWGTGIDESQEVMITAANEAKARRGIGNVDFQTAKAISLPFEDEALDFVFSERGPLARSDNTLSEALRILRPGGLIFTETIGEIGSWETMAAFDPTYKKPTTITAVLNQERDRFERFNLKIQLLASRIQTLQFEDFYEWLKFQCNTWNPPRREMLSVDRKEEFERLMAIAGDDEGHINITHHTIWIAGMKTDQPKGSTPDS